MTNLEKKVITQAHKILSNLCDSQDNCIKCPHTNGVNRCPALLLEDVLKIAERTPEKCKYFGSDAGSLYEYCHVSGLPFTRIDCCDCEQFKPREEE